MARFGRGQPHAPIFLRTPLVAAVVAVATVSPIHVVSPAPARTRNVIERHAAVVYLRPGVTSLVPDRIPPQFHVVLQPRHRQVPPVHVQFLRNPQPGFLSALAPPNHVISLATERFRPERRASIVFLRPSVSSLVPDRLPTAIHVVGLVPERPLGGRRAAVVVLRAPVVAAAPAEQHAPQIHILLQPRRAADPRGHVQILRAPVLVAAPAAQAAPQIHVLLQSRHAADRRGHVQFIRTPLVPLAPPRAPQPHVISLALDRGQQPVARRTAVVWIRPPVSSVVPTRLPVRIHVVGLPVRRGRSDREPALVFIRGGPAPFVTLIGPLQASDSALLFVGGANPDLGPAGATDGGLWIIGPDGAGLLWIGGDASDLGAAGGSDPDFEEDA